MDVMDRTLKQQSNVLLLTLIGWLTAKYISRKLWLGNHLFPKVPMIALFNNVPISISIALLLVSIAAMFYLLVKPLSKWALATVLVAEAICCLLDINRLQPWEYQYVFTLLLLLIHYKSPERFLQSVAFMLVATYFYSGLHKFNDGFLLVVWKPMLSKLFHFTVATNSAFYKFGYALASIELLIAVGLIFAFTRRFAAYCLICMHLFNIVMLGPLGFNANIVVWPWNIIMIGLLYVLFVQANIAVFKPTIFTKSFAAVFVFWGLLPLGSFFNKWDYYLSSCLYSGKVKDVVICVASTDSSTLKKLKPYSFKKDSLNYCKGNLYISLAAWALKEIKVPTYPEDRVFKAIADSFNHAFPTCVNSFYYSYNRNNTKVIKPLK